MRFLKLSVVAIAVLAVASACQPGAAPAVETSVPSALQTGAAQAPTLLPDAASTAAAALQGVPLGRPTASCQRHAEVAAAAEVVHFKAMMLLLHQQRYAEAISQLRGHLAAFGHLPGQ